MLDVLYSGARAAARRPRAVFLPVRCPAAATLAGVDPAGRADLDCLVEWGLNVAKFDGALEGQRPLRDWLEENGGTIRNATADDLVRAFGGLLPEIDRVIATAYARTRTICSKRT